MSDIKISNSGVTLFRRCPKKYWWKYIRKIEPIRPSSAILLGDLIHGTFANYYQSTHNKEKSLEYLINFGVDLTMRMPPEEQEDFAIISGTACAMWENVPDWMLDGKDVSTAEKYFEIKLTEGITYRGYIDRLVKANGKLLIRELKTCAFPDSYIRSAGTSSQASGYVLGAQTEIDKEVVGVSYDLIRKPALRKRGTENMQDFVARIREDYRTRPEWYYRREYTYRNDKNLDEFVDDLCMCARDIRSKYESNQWYRNHDACFARGECEYYKICFNYDEMTEKIFYKPVVDRETKAEAEDVEE